MTNTEYNPLLPPHPTFENSTVGSQDTLMRDILEQSVWTPIRKSKRIPGYHCLGAAL